MGFLFGPKPDSGMGATPTPIPTIGTTTPTAPITTPTSNVIVHNCNLVHLTSVEFLDGVEIINGIEEPKIMIADSVQYVNLPREQKFVDGIVVKNIDRLGRKIKVKVKFCKEGNHEFWLGFDSSLIHENIYSTTEEANNNNYNYQKLEIYGTTDADGTKIIELYTTVGGKDKFRIKARDNFGTELTSKTIETRRIIYYKEIKMRGLTADCASSLSVLKNEFLQHGVKLISLGSSEMTPLKNIDATKISETTAFLSNVQAAYTASSKSPYVMAIGYTSHQGIKKLNVELMVESVTIGARASDIVVPVSVEIVDRTDLAGRRKISIPYSLWKDMDTTDWFVQASFKNNTTGTVTSIPKSNITPITMTGYATNNCGSLKVKVSDLSTTTEVGKIIVMVNIVKGFTGGLSYPNTNVLCVSTKAWWVKKTNIEQNQVLIHELGHSIGMVSDGANKKPDRVSTYYDGSKGLRSDGSKGHWGSHCYFGLSSTLSSYWGVTGSSCVMFGSTNGLSSFCINCAPAVKKMDLTKGWV